ncbi:MAG: DsbA family protein [Candidatus Bipolaricaulia bacterium]
MAKKSGKVLSPILIVILAALVVAAALIVASQWSAQRHRAALNPPTQTEPEEGAQTETQPEAQPQQSEEQAQTGQAESPPATTTAPTPTWPPTEGSPDAPVTMVEFADFYCPYCARYLQETYPQIKADYIDKGLVRYEFRNLVVHGPPALLAAVGGVCAEEQGRFWDYHRRFYQTVFTEGEQQIDESGLGKIAAGLGLDTTSFNSCVEGYSKDFNRCFRDYQNCTSGGGDKEQCAADFNQCLSGNELATTALGDQGVLRSLIDRLPPNEQAKAQKIGTPLFFINNHILIGAQPYDNFKRLIDQALKEAGGSGS